MNKVSWIDEKIKETLAMGEEGILIDQTHLEKVKIRLKNNDQEVNMRINFRGKTFRLSVVTIVLMVLFGGALGVAATTLIRTDNVNYKFVDDPRVIGKWQSVDFVNTVGEFSPNKKAFGENLYLKELVFIKDGKMLNSINSGNEALAFAPMVWTKGKIINRDEKTASSYEIADINGAQYMFFEWKSGDYIFGGLNPKYYVLKKVDEADYSDMQISRKVDDINLPFVKDPEVSGSWKTVDFVKTIDSFEPGKKSWIPDLFLTGLVFNAEGMLGFRTTREDCEFSWTKGFVLNPVDQTASAYTIKEIDGKEYMFFEWKSGDYSFRGMKPYYYVLERK